MKCPRCVGMDLLTCDRRGVEIDICPFCRGIWLDREELEKIIERSSDPETVQGADDGRGSVPPEVTTYEEFARREQEYQRHRTEEYQDQYYRNRKSFWEELLA